MCQVPGILGPRQLFVVEGLDGINVTRTCNPARALCGCLRCVSVWMPTRFWSRRPGPVCRRLASWTSPEPRSWPRPTLLSGRAPLGHFSFLFFSPFKWTELKLTSFSCSLANLDRRQCGPSSPSFFRPWSLAKDLQNPGTWSGSAARCKTLASSKGQ